MVVKCPKGHWFETELSGGRCPQCATQTREGSAVSDDDVMAIMSEPEDPPPAQSPADEVAKAASGSGIMRRKKICPECSHEASFSFVYCPRCGAPLKLASVELHKS
jgi:hypothetical protein